MSLVIPPEWAHLVKRAGRSPRSIQNPDLHNLPTNAYSMSSTTSRDDLFYGECDWVELTTSAYPMALSAIKDANPGSVVVGNLAVARPV